MRPLYLLLFLLLWLAAPFTAHARLTLGAAPEDTPGLLSPEKARQLADALGEAMGEEVSLKIFNSRDELDQWLVKFSMIDLAVHDAAFLAGRPGKYLVIGAADAAGRLFIVSRQGVAGDLPQRVARALQRPLTTATAKVSAKTATTPPEPRPQAVQVPPAAAKPQPVAPVRKPETPAEVVKPTSAPPALAAAAPVTPTAGQPASQPTKPAEPTITQTLKGAPPPVAPPPPLVFPELPASLPPSAKLPARDAPVAVVDEPPPAPEAMGTPSAPPTEPAPATVAAAEPPAQPVKAVKRIKPVGPVVPPPASSPEPVEEKPQPAAVAPIEAAEEKAPVPATVETPAAPEPAATPPAPPTEPAPATVAAAEPPAEPVEAVKRIKPVGPVVPPPASSPGPVKPEPQPAAVAAAGAIGKESTPLAEPEAARPEPAPVETPVATVAMSRPEPAGVTPPTEVQPPVIADEVPAVIAQPDIPQELRPPGIPAVRPSKLLTAPPPKEDVRTQLTAKLPEKIGRTQKPGPLLPPPDPEPGIVYVVPFITLMVPDAVRERIFDQFVDKLNESGANRKLRFVILKESLEKIDREWLDARKYVFGEIFGYVEESGCCSTDLRAKARLTYYRAHHPQPSLRYEFPIRTFFDHNKTSIEVERQRLADQIANALVSELTKALQP